MNNDLLINDIEYENTKLREENSELKSKALELEALVKHYEELLRLTKSRQFSRSSEKAMLSSQLGLFDEAENTADRKLPEPKLHEIVERKKPVSKLLKDLPTEKVEYSLDDKACPNCGNELHVMSEDVRKEIKIIPAKVVIVEHVQNIYSCRNCEKTAVATPIIKASAPQPLIKGSLVSASAVAHIMVQKYVNSVPLYRQEQELLTQGISLSRQNMSNWLISSTQDYLKLLYEHMKQELNKREILHADETVLEVLKEPGRKANTNSYMWLYRTSIDTNHPLVLYEYKETRSSSHPKRFLEKFKGYLHTDGYSGYHVLPETIKVVGCFAHLRRKFADALKALPEEERSKSTAAIGFDYCNRLFALERSYACLGTEEKYTIRLAESLPIAEALLAWARTVQALPKSALGNALEYLLKQWPYLKNFYLDGRLELSNNRAERSIKPFVIGRKNWLFSNTPKGAESSSIIYSIIETAKENNLKPREYLEHILEKLPGTALSDVPKFLPWSDSIPDHCRIKA